MKSSKQLVVYEGAMCCSTGICGPEPDKQLIEFSETLKKLQNEHKDLKITRASLSFNLEKFLEDKDIFQMVKDNGPGILPITVVDGKIIAKQRYLSYIDLQKEIETY